MKSTLLYGALDVKKYFQLDDYALDTELSGCYVLTSRDRTGQFRINQI